MDLVVAKSLLAWLTTAIENADTVRNQRRGQVNTKKGKNAK
jgi:hypothetical protein